MYPSNTNDQNQAAPPFVPHADGDVPADPPLGSALIPGAVNTQDSVTPVMSGGATPQSESKGLKKILTVLGVFLMLAGIGAGVFLVRRQQLESSFAWDCTLYSFSIDQNGTVTVLNGSGRNEPSQSAKVYINGNLVETFSVPSLASGEGATLGTVSVPTGASYSWIVEGTKDCKNTGKVEVETYTAQCLNIQAFDEDWNHLTTADLSNLRPGDVVRFSVAGTTTQGEINKARFSVNGAPAVETTDLRPGTQEFYYEYTVPAEVTSFTIKAELMHSLAGWF